MAAGAAILIGVFLDPEFSDGRPGLIDGAVGVIAGMTGGRFAGRATSRAHERDLLERLGFWRSWLRQSFGLSSIVFMVSFFGALLSALLVSAYLWELLRLGPPWFGPGEFMQVGAGVTALISYWIALGVILERWYRSLPE